MSKTEEETAKTLDSEPKADRISELEARLNKYEGKLKGYAGQIGELRASVGLGKPGSKRSPAKQALEEPDRSLEEGSLAAKQATPEPVQSHTEYPWMKSCPGCGEENKNFKPATVFCAKCGNPLSSSTDPKDIEAINKCGSNGCEGTPDGKGSILVRGTAPREVTW